jgi:hypothetical protein
LANKKENHENTKDKKEEVLIHLVFRLSSFCDSLLSLLHLRAPDMRIYRNQCDFATIPMARVYTSLLITEFSHRVMLLGLAKR